MTHKGSLKSSAERKGDIVTQIITFDRGVKKTVRGIKTATINQGQFTKYETTDGRLVYINDSKVLSVETFSENG